MPRSDRPRKMRIAVLSHNDIRKDARIIKEIQTLEKDFCGVVAFGLTHRSEPESAAPYPFRSPVILTERRMSEGEAQALLAGWPRRLSHRRLRRAGTGLLILAGALALGAAASVLPVILPILSLVAGLTLIGLSRHLRRRFRRVMGEGSEPQRDASMVCTSPKTGEPVNIARQRLQLFKQSYHLVNAVSAEARRHGRFDVIHAHDLVGLEAGIRIKKQHGGILIWDAHEIYEDLANPDPAIAAHARAVIAASAPLVDHFITINEGLARFYRQNHPALPDAILLMNATVRAEPPDDDGRLRRALAAEETQKILLFQGGLSLNRGLPSLLRAAQHFPEGWLLALMGDGHLRSELQVIADEVNETVGEERIRFLPPVPQAELIRWTAGATLGAVPYENVAANHWFCTPNKLWEYPAAGVPFIAPRLHEIERIVEEYQTGFLFPVAFDEHSIAALIASIDDKAIANKRKNITRFIEEMSWERFAPRLTGLYATIASTLEQAAGEPKKELVAASVIEPASGRGV